MAALFCKGCLEKCFLQFSNAFESFPKTPPQVFPYILSAKVFFENQFTKR